jgi:hypothetical protein
MGAVCCKPEDDELGDPTFGSTRVKSWKRSKWRTDEAITASQLQVQWQRQRKRWPVGLFQTNSAPHCSPVLALLQRMRDEFWDTEPHYGGNRGGYQSTSIGNRSIAPAWICLCAHVAVCWRIALALPQGVSVVHISRGSTKLSRARPSSSQLRNDGLLR